MAIQRIDMHTHVFNVRYLPLEGIIRSRGVPDIFAKALMNLLNAATGDAIEPAAGSPLKASLAAAAAVPPAATKAQLLASLAARTPKELIDDPDVKMALAVARRVSPAKMAAATAASVPTADASAQFTALFAQLGSMKPEPGLFQTADEYIKWFHFLTNSERDILKALFDAYGADVHLFIHHMMDMSHYYPHGRCYYDFVNDQLPRMRRLVEAHKGRLLTFVAYSPDRPGDLNVVARALADADAAGVKFYPPNGYLPNERRHDDLYTLLGDRVPLFAHCTPEGMQAKPGFGLKSDPKYWADVLARFPKLRLCLAHAGGDEPWFKASKWAKSFAESAVQLAATYDNVYLEFGYHEDILDPGVRNNFITRLATVLQENPGIAKKIMYGTDWHMIAKIKNHEEYFRAFAATFEDPRLSAVADAFFYTNAHDYLNLPEFQALREQLRGPGDPVVTHLAKVIRTASAKKRAAARSSGRRRSEGGPQSRSKKPRARAGSTGGGRGRSPRRSGGGA
jgi:predicted TIM-barrel fold metal-dependent hydrolase